jgi:hypothetical protein
MIYRYFSLIATLWFPGSAAQPPGQCIPRREPGSEDQLNQLVPFLQEIGGGGLFRQPQSIREVTSNTCLTCPFSIASVRRSQLMRSFFAISATVPNSSGLHCSERAQSFISISFLKQVAPYPQTNIESRTKRCMRGKNVIGAPACGDRECWKYPTKELALG